MNQTDGSANFTYAYGSGPFGERSTDALATYGVTQSDGGSKTLPFRFAGGAELDFETGQQYLRARYYLPSAGRFTSRDTYGGYGSRPQTQNRYSYAGNNPVNRTDPSGHEVGTGLDNPCLEDAVKCPGGMPGGGSSGGGGIGGYSATGTILLYALVELAKKFGPQITGQWRDDKYVYRLMKVDWSDGGPALFPGGEESRRYLYARSIDNNGLSATVNPVYGLVDKGSLANFAKGDMVFRIPISELDGFGLKFVPDHGFHGTIQPKNGPDSMSQAEFNDRLALTRSQWERTDFIPNGAVVPSGFPR